ncbi:MULTISPECIES: hypothetical protein [Brevibacillus]|jgi:hypothetical protein|uniref:hypothetical protein n=1 Tax=Brevibacillus TaxID=55080 RepID=UPI0004699D94|nr:hypothetical protein [Brevibacillus borstelensis]KKX55619.1 hypothetical protein X546_08110 [Brevibacillus borstelensis cifa_chp40]MCC0563397.1 hypothetical protein [Brevibacillus borstelensis]MCM3471408.1 hypothetical protein [Brevibacillus borstelensis]MCM3621653.1 hypothetical protein [Brevibacillus borstelensis]MED2010136.1 hypothetical protein [Brevibacillus borstelensis]
MKKVIGIWLTAILLIAALTACSQNAKPADEKAPQKTEEASSDTKTSDTSSSEANKAPGEAVPFEVVGQSSEDAPTDQGQTEVRLGGNVTVEEKELVIKGTSNLLPGAIVEAEVTSKGYNMWGYKAKTEVNGDGSFEMTVKKPDVKNTMDVELSFDPYDQSDRLKKVYGDSGEKLAGPFVYQSSNFAEMAYYAAAYAHVAHDAPLKTAVAFETPKWDRPSDYGDPTVWFKPTVTKDEKYLYVSVKSNLLEGATVKGDVDIPGHIHYGYTDSTRVKPDGSFTLQIAHPKKVKEYYFLIRYEPEEVTWPTLKEAYGTKGEKLKGELVKVKDKDDKTINIVEMKIKITE